MRKILCAAAGALLLMAGRAAAHHSFAAEYDAKKLVTVSGTVIKFSWMNPHVWLYVEGVDANGAKARWGFEMGSPNGMHGRGWRKTTLKAGDHITIDGYAAKDGRNIANSRMVTLPDGRKLFGGFHETPKTPGP